MDTTMTTLDQFIGDTKITMTVSRTDHNPSMTDTADMDHWRVTLKRNGKQMSLVFSMGYGLNGAEPTVADVLDSLASDASSVRQTDFPEWARDMGWSDDSIKARKTYLTIEKQAARLRRLLGSDKLLDRLLYHTERL
jgi:hypothetical protein